MENIKEPSTYKISIHRLRHKNNTHNMHVLKIKINFNIIPTQHRLSSFCLGKCEHDDLPMVGSWWVWSNLKPFPTPPFFFISFFGLTFSVVVGSNTMIHFSQYMTSYSVAFLSPEPVTIYLSSTDISQLNTDDDSFDWNERKKPMKLLNYLKRSLLLDGLLTWFKYWP